MCTLSGTLFRTTRSISESTLQEDEGRRRRNGCTVPQCGKYLFINCTIDFTTTTTTAANTVVDYYYIYGYYNILLSPHLISSLTIISTIIIIFYVVLSTILLLSYSIISSSLTILYKKYLSYLLQVKVVSLLGAPQHSTHHNSFSFS